MKKFGLLLIIVLISLQSSSQERNFIDQPYLETIATADSLVIPNRVYLSILITEKDTRGKTSVEELESRMNTKLTGLGININKELTLSDVTSNFKRYFLKGTDILKNKVYTLLVYNAEVAAKVIVGLESIGISNVYLQKVEYSKLEQVKIELKQKAVVKAKKQAELMLKPLGQNIGKALYISDLNQNQNITNRLQGTVSGIKIRGYSSHNARAYKQINVEFDKIKIESTVTIKFGIE